MKTRSIIISIFLTLLLAACVTPHLYTTEISVLKDVTDKQLAQPDATEIFSLYRFTGSDKWNGGTFQFSTVSDVSLNKTRIVKIEKENQWLANELERDRQVKRFKNGISEIIQGDENDSLGKNNSSVYLALAKTLNTLSESKSKRRILLVYSDLMENTPVISFYDQSQLELLRSNPEIIQKQLEEMLPLKTLTGIEVHFVYQPDEVNTDLKFQIVSAFYGKLIESKGAKVSIEANIQNL